jgi:hypothetical protein
MKHDRRLNLHIPPNCSAIYTEGMIQYIPQEEKIHAKIKSEYQAGEGFRR